MYKNFYPKKLLLLCFVVLIFSYNNTFGAINEVTCDSEFSSNCNQCFKSDSNLYLGYLRKDIADIWKSTDGEYLYEDENTNPISLNPFYKNGELTQGPGKFIYSPGLTDKSTSNGEFFKDSVGDLYIDFNAGTRGEIVKSDSNFFIKFDKLSEEIKSNGRNKPLFEFKYIFNYYSKKDSSKTKKTHTECIFKYPAWCGDGVFDSGKEECEYNAKPGQPGYNLNCNQECKIPSSPGSCERGNIILPLKSEINKDTPGLCKPGENVTYFNSESPFPNIIDYTWECNGHLGPNCKTTFYKDSNPSCGNLTGYPTGEVDIGTTSNLNCNGINGKDDTGYKIEVQKDGGSFIGITGTRNNNNNYTAQYKFSLPGKYNFRCLVGGETTPRDSCENNNEIKVKLPFCGDGIIQPPETCEKNSDGTWPTNCNQTTCQPNPSNSCINGGIPHNLSAPIDQNASGLCRAGETVSGFISSPASTSPVNYSWSCNGNSGGNCSSVYSFGGGGREPCGNGVIDPGEMCDFNDTYYRVNWQNGNYCSAKCDYPTGGGGGGGAFCGNGIIEGNEQCEKENINGVMQFWNGCRSNCTLDWSIFTNPGSCTGPRICPSTTPAGGTIDFGPNGNIIIGHESNAFQDFLEKPYVINNTKHELGGFEKLCVKHTNGNNISYPTSYGTDGKICIDMPRVFVPGQKIEFYNSPEFKGNKDTIGLNNYGDNILTTTIQAIDKSTGISKLYESAYFVAKLNVRVSRPSVSTVGGGTSYVSDSSKVADLNKVTNSKLSNGEDFSNGSLDNNKNFVGTSVGNGQISSYSQSITKIDKENKISNSYSGSINNNNSKNTTLITPSSDFTKFKPYNGLSDVFIIKDTDFEINNSTFINSLKQATTFIIDNGDLTINSNINFKDYNIAFIVKGAGKNIIITSDVTEINGTYITIGGKFRGDSSKVQLKVYGSLYGDISDLIDHRYYIKQNSNGQIDVGTIISFGSSIFRKTAPLTGEFIGEYLKSNKIAQ